VAGGARDSADDVLVAALAAGKTRRAAARIAEVSEATVYRRLQEEDFIRLVADARAEMVGRALGQLSGGAAEASITLRQLLRKGDDKIRLGAARALLEFVLKVQDQADLERRLSDLESKLKEKRPS
jgi:hypothetical protein